jgi:ABC-2 type transport system permease protein
VSLPAQGAEMARRSVLQTLRQPAMVIPPIVFPLILMAVNVGGLQVATRLPGFPTDNYLNFAIAFPFIQGSLLGNLAGVMTVALFSALIYLAAGFAAGLHFEAGAAGVLVLLVLALLIALAFASLGALIGLRTGSGEAVQGVFPLLFVLVFLSSNALPRDLIAQHWFRAIATVNPVSYLFEGLRSLVIFGWDGEALALGFGVAVTIALLGVFGAAAALRTRLVRT